MTLGWWRRNGLPVAAIAVLLPLTVGVIGTNEWSEHGRATQPIVVDLSRSREVTPIALAALVDDFERLRPVRFRGLSQHASRVLAHLTRTPSRARSTAL